MSGIIVLMTQCKKEEDNNTSRETLIRSMVDDINSDSLRADVQWFQNMGTRFTLAENRRTVAIKIRDRFRKLGYDQALLDSFLVTKTYRNVQYTQWQYNITATITGSVYPDSVCILGGHYDDILSSGDPFTAVPGANDNASGAAAALEVARIMKKHDFRPEKSIMFIAFGSEETGLFGSSNFASSTDRKIAFMLNNDMIAYEPGSDPSLWKVNIMDYSNSHTLRSYAEQMTSRYTILSYKNDNTNNKYSDSYPFFLQGYKALFFFSDKTDPNYHTLNDIVTNCNFEYCREIVKISCAVLATKTD
jgi:leucyl aminopeptidase